MLADKATISAVETYYKEPLAELTQRLSVLFGIEIKNENNPYGPALFCRSFRKTIKPIGLAHKVNLCCYQVFKDVLLSEVGPLYAALNEKLVGGGILPVITYKVEKPAVQRASPQRATTGTAPDRPAQGRSANGESPAPGSQRHAPAAHVPNIIDLFGTLRSLQQNTAGPGRHHIPDQYAPSASKSAVASHSPGSRPMDLPETAPVHYSPKQLVEALARLSPTAPSGRHAIPARDYRAEALTLLAGQQNGAAAGDIGDRESTIIDVASHMFRSMETDIQVSEQVRHWLQRLELPVLKVALLDDSLLRDKSHPLRQVINKISQLEALADNADEASQRAIRDTIELVIDLVNNDFDPSAATFLEARRRLNTLVKAQEKSYSENVRKVIEQAEQQEQSLGARSGQAGPETPVDWYGVSREERASWLKRVHRLTAGTMIVFDAESPKPRRRRIVWISPGARRFILVDSCGRKALEMHADALAKALRNQRAMLVDSADEPAMDRAQYDMLQDLHTKLIHQSTHDQLTGLVSRREFEKRLKEAHALAQRDNSQHAICFIDLDGFSVINNACGYEGGDKLLKEISVLLQIRLDKDSVLARIGSDEFGLLLTNCALDEATDFVEQRWKEIQDYRLTWDNKRLSIGASIGLVPVTQYAEDVGKLLQAAESGCSIAKDLGGNRVQVFQPENVGLSRRNEVSKWALEIDRVLDEETLYLRCQRIKPILGNNAEHGHYEVLLGIRDSNGEHISTPEFIEAAERYNRMPKVDRWVIKTAFRWIANNRNRLHDIDGFSINLSGCSLNDDTFLQFIKKELDTTAVPKNKVCFEVTETVGIASLSDAVEFIWEIKKTGCKFSLDDFGTGMSSYAYLRDLPVDFLKIDGAFVKDMVNNPCDAAVVKSICEIGHFMDKKVIAEYVEDDVILEQLRALGVDYAQGYAVGKPIALEELGRVSNDGYIQ